MPHPKSIVTCDAEQALRPYCTLNSYAKSPLCIMTCLSLSEAN